MVRRLYRKSRLLQLPNYPRLPHITGEDSLLTSIQLCFGAMVVQVIQGGSGDLRTQYPSLTFLVAAFFFPIGLIMLVLTGQDLCTANFSKSTARQSHNLLGHRLM